MLLCMMGGFTVSTVAIGVTDAPDTPYQEIVNRNVFALKPPPPPPDPEANKPPPPKITLTGITTIIGKKALMEAPAPPGKPGEPPKTKQCYTLAEGQREGDIEVLQIDEKTGSVKVKNGGQELTLTFDKDGSKLPATPPPSATPGLPGALPGVPPPPTGIMPPPMKTAEGSMPTFPTRNLRTPNAGLNQGAGITPAMAAPGGLAYQPAVAFQPAGGNQGTVALPSFAGPQLGGSQPALPQQQLSPEEQTILIEAAREQKTPLSGLLPPTALNPTVNVLPGQPGQGTVPGQTRTHLPPLPGAH